MVAHVDAICSLRSASNRRHETLLAQALAALSIERLHVVEYLATMAWNAESYNAYIDRQHVCGLEGYKNV